jgi:hypothetical protein
MPASSLSQVEVMMGRRVAEDGGITVDDTDYIAATNWIIAAASAADAAEQHRTRAMLASAPVVPVITKKLDGISAIRERIVSGTELPPNVHLLSLDRVGVESSSATDQARVLLRVWHM